MLTGATASAMYRGYKRKNLLKKLNGNTTTTVTTHYTVVL